MTKRTKPSAHYEQCLLRQGFTRIAGIDEAGMASLAGPVVAAAVVFNSHRNIKDINDSKLLSPEKREELYYIILEKAIGIGVGIVPVEVINDINIYWASRQAMIEAIRQIDPLPDYLIIDGNKPLKIEIQQESLVKGDGKCFSVAAASIIAKVSRDKIMIQLHEDHPEYGWAQNKAYPTKFHREAIQEYGITPHHRRNFKGVKEYV